MTARSHQMRRIRRLPMPTSSELTEIARRAIESGAARVRKFAPGAHAGFMPAMLKNL